MRWFILRENVANAGARSPDANCIRRKKSYVSANMLKKIWSVGRRICFMIIIILRIGPVFYENTGILLRVGALLFILHFTDKKKQSRVFKTGLVGLAETQFFLYAYFCFMNCLINPSHTE